LEERETGDADPGSEAPCRPDATLDTDRQIEVTVSLREEFSAISSKAIELVWCGATEFEWLPWNPLNDSDNAWTSKVLIVAALPTDTDVVWLSRQSLAGDGGGGEGTVGDSMCIDVVERTDKGDGT